MEVLSTCKKSQIWLELLLTYMLPAISLDDSVFIETHHDVQIVAKSGDQDHGVR